MTSTGISSDLRSSSGVAPATGVAPAIGSLFSDLSSIEHNPNEVETTFEKEVASKNKRKIGGQKVLNITAKEAHVKKPVKISPTQWDSLTKASEQAKKILLPEKTWQKIVMYSLGLPVSAPLAAVTGIALAAMHGAKAVAHGAKYIKANSSKSPKTPAFIYNILPFRKKDFVELTDEEKDKFCEKMDKAWEKYREIYNKDKEEDEQIKSEDVVRWIFEIPKKKNARFGFRIIYRIPDKNGKYVKGSKDKSRKYKVDKDNFFEYKMTYLFWGKIDEDKDPIFYESTSIVDNWDIINSNKDERDRLRAKSLTELKEKIKKAKNLSVNTKVIEKAKQNNPLHTTVQKALNNKKIKDVLKDEKKLNEKFYEKIQESSIDKRKELWKLKEQLNNLIECIKKCIDKPSHEQFNIIEEKYSDKKSYAERIREDLHILKDKKIDPDMLYKLLKNYLEKIGVIKNVTIEEKEQRYNSSGMERKKLDEPKYVGELKSIKITEPFLNSINLKKAIENYFEGTSDQSIKIEKQHSIKEKPSSIDIEIEGKSLETIPFKLKYADKKFIVDDSGDFEFNYATIHENDGHYFSIKKEDDSWYLYDITKNLEDKEALKIDNIEKYLKELNAKKFTLVYEDRTN